MRFEDAFMLREHRYSLGVETDSRTHFAAIPMSNQRVDTMERYKVSDVEYQRFIEYPAEARRFVESCRRREQDERLFLQPGAGRGVPR